MSDYLIEEEDRIIVFLLRNILEEKIIRSFITLTPARLWFKDKYSIADHILSKLEEAEEALRLENIAQVSYGVGVYGGSGDFSINLTVRAGSRRYYCSLDLKLIAEERGDGVLVHGVKYAFLVHRVYNDGEDEIYVHVGMANGFLNAI